MNSLMLSKVKDLDAAPREGADITTQDLFIVDQRQHTAMMNRVVMHIAKR